MKIENLGAEQAIKGQQKKEDIRDDEKNMSGKSEKEHTIYQQYRYVCDDACSFLCAGTNHTKDRMNFYSLSYIR